jgi:hypothetical protein
MKFSAFYPSQNVLEIDRFTSILIYRQEINPHMKTLKSSRENEIGLANHKNLRLIMHIPMHSAFILGKIKNMHGIA